MLFAVSPAWATTWVDTDRDPEEGQRILHAHKLYAPGEESDIEITEASHGNWEGWHPRGPESWKVVHEAIQLNATNERDVFVMQGLKSLGIERGKPFEPTAEQARILEEAADFGEACGRKCRTCPAAGSRSVRVTPADDPP